MGPKNKMRSSGGVYRRAMLEDKITPNRGPCCSASLSESWTASPRSRPLQIHIWRIQMQEQRARLPAQPLQALQQRMDKKLRNPLGHRSQNPGARKQGPESFSRIRPRPHPSPRTWVGNPWETSSTKSDDQLCSRLVCPRLFLPPAGDKPPSAEEVDISMEDDDELDTAAPSPGLGKLE